jgi:tetratricopeptide (TPR) repeat protein
MHPFSLRLPDDPDWHVERDYSGVVANALSAAYRHLHRAAWQAKAFVDAFADIRPFLDEHMARQQHLRVFYVVALAAAAIGDYDTALDWLDEAFLLADALHDVGALVDLLYVRGAVNRGLNHVGEAAADYEDCLAHFRDENLFDTPLGPAIELELLTQLGGFAFFSGRFDVAERLLHEARARALLGSRIDSSRLVMATLDWLQALLYRWCGQPELACAPAQSAADVFIEVGSPASAARIRAILADVQLDLGERMPGGTVRDRSFAHARSNLCLAASLAIEAQDPIGKEFVRLRTIRLDRLLQRNQSQVRRIERVLRTAGRLHDDAVLAEALTALGDELSMQGQKAAALDQYRQVIGLLDGSQISAVGVWAQRALHNRFE